MIQPWTFTLFPLLFVQIYFLRYAHTSSSANLVRKALLPLILFTAWHYALDNCIEPELTNFAANLGLFGTTAGFSAARAVIWAFVDPSKAYVWRAPNPPTTSLSWVWQVFADWRGMNWSFGARIPKPAPLASDVSGFLKAALVRAFACHVGFLVGAFPSVHYTQEGRHLDEILLPSLGLETNTLSTRLASMVQTIAYGLTGMCTLELIFWMTALQACLLVSFGHALGVCGPFDATLWPPLFRSPLRISNLKDFWTQRWHTLFTGVFMTVAFDPGRLLGKSLGLGRPASYFLGLAFAFALSGAIHEFGSYVATKSFGLDPTFRTFTAFFVQTFGFLAEQFFTRTTGRSVGGVLGFLWTATFLVLAFSFLVDAWFERGLVAGAPLYSDWHWQRYLLPFAPQLPADVLTQHS